MRPCASATETVMTETSSPSALMVVRFGVSWTAAGSPVVSTFVSAMTLPSASKPFALKVPGSYFTFHDRWEFGCIVCLPSDAPFRNNSTCLQLLNASTRISWPSLPGPVPVRQQMQNGVRRPPRLVIIKIVLRKTAHVEHAEMRIDARPAVRRRLATIIKTGPHETAAQPRTVGEKAPPCFRRLRPLGVVHVIGADIAALPGRSRKCRAC